MFSLCGKVGACCGAVICDTMPDVVPMSDKAERRSILKDGSAADQSWAGNNVGAHL